MHPAIEILMHEHRAIEQVLDSLLCFLEHIEPHHRPTVARYAEFIRLFADKCHHGKEEDRLFVRMSDSGFPRDRGPIAVMVSEHDQGRAHAGVLTAIGEGSGPMTDQELQEVRHNAQQYASLLRNHISKEDTILYPMALRAIPTDQLDALVAQYEAFERGVIGEGEHARLHSLAHELVTQYPPRDAHDEVHACAGCF